jgi:hypothetical protein
LSSVPYVKFLTSPLWGDMVRARVIAGPDRERAKYVGCVWLPSTYLEQMLDALVFGASEVTHPNGKMTVAFGPDEENAA